MTTNLLLSCTSVEKGFHQGETPISVLTDLNLQVSTGERLAILGESGSGKSTLLSLMAGLDKPDKGTVLFQNESLGNMDDDQRAELRAHKIGIIFQQFHLLPHLTAQENVELSWRVAHRGKAAESEAPQRATALLDKVGLSHRSTHFPDQLSGGECQRVAIARSLITEPPLILADEPSGSLDEDTGTKIMDHIFDLCTEFGTTLILVTHNRELATHCDRTLYLYGGGLNQDEPHHDEAP